jgi:anti-anti-sigma factor
MPDPAYKHIKATMVDDVLVVEIDTTEVQGPAIAQELGAELSQVVADFRARKVLLDFTGVNYLGSIAFAALSKTVKNVRGAGGQIKFCNMEPSVRRAADIIFGTDIVGSQHAVEIHDSRVRAVVSFAMS